MKTSRNQPIPFPLFVPWIIDGLKTKTYKTMKRFIKVIARFLFLFVVFGLVGFVLAGVVLCVLHVALTRYVEFPAWADIRDPMFLTASVVGIIGGVLGSLFDDGFGGPLIRF